LLYNSLARLREDLVEREERKMKTVLDVVNAFDLGDYDKTYTNCNDHIVHFPIEKLEKLYVQKVTIEVDDRKVTIKLKTTEETDIYYDAYLRGKI
jgi:hypothetical protein